MKHILFVFALLATFGASAQTTSTRPQVQGTYDASSISYKTVTLADAVGTDTLNLRPNTQTGYYNVTVTDSINLNLKSTAGLCKGDRLHLFITKGTGTGAVTLLGNWVVSTGTTRIALTASKKNLLIFEFDGANFIEVSRNLNY